MSDDTPTQRFDAPLTPSTPATTTSGEPTPDEKRRRRMTTALIVLSALLLAGLIIVVIILLTRGGTPTGFATPTDSATPSNSPSVSVTPSASPAPIPTTAHTTAPAPPPPASSGPTLSSFSSPTKVSCNAANNPIPLDFSWTGTGAAAYLAVGATADPKSNGQGWTLPPTGTQADFPQGQEILYPCNQATATYTIGVYDNGGNKVVKQFVVKNNGTVG